MNNDKLACVKQLYPNRGDEPFSGPSDYSPLIQSLGTVLLRVDDVASLGDAHVILKRRDEYGLFIFGWGSCSGCDALQACETYEEIEELRQNLENDIKWMSAKDLLAYVETHDWRSDYSWHDGSVTKQFVEQATVMLRDLVAAEA